LVGIRGEWVNTDPQKGKDGSEEDRPDNDDGGGSVLPTQETLKEGVQVDYNPKGKEKLPKEWTPRLIPAVDGIGDPSHNPNQVDQ